MKTSAPHSESVTRGRPREFDMDAALDQAERLFSERGYHAASIGDLGAAMGLSAGSIYKAFTDKRTLLLAALERYSNRRHRQVREAAARGSTGRERLRHVLENFAAASLGTQGRQGCLVIATALELAPFDAEIGQRINHSFTRNEAFLAELIEQGRTDGSIAASVDPASTARVMICITQGFRVLGKAGRHRASELEAAVYTALKLLD